MRIGNEEKNPARVFKSIGLLLFIVAWTPMVRAQVQNWWVLPSGGDVELGRLSELRSKRNVYVDVVLNGPGPGQITSATEQADIRKSVVDAFKSHKEFSVVTGPERADFAVLVRTTVSVPGADVPRPANFSVVLDQDEEVSVEVTVLVPGSKQRDGTLRSRTVWESFSSNVQMGVLAGSRFAVDGFLWELKKVREKK